MNSVDRISAKTGKTKDQVSALFQGFHGSETHKVVAASIEVAIDNARMSLEKSKVWDEVKELQGNIKGLKSALNAISMKEDK